MKLRINDTETEFSLEREESLADVLHSVDSWLEHESHILTGVRVNGTDIPAEELEQAGARDIHEIETLEIKAVHWVTIYREALVQTASILALPEQERPANWAASPAESFLLVRDRELHDIVAQAIDTSNAPEAGEKTSAEMAGTLVHARMAETEHPEEALTVLVRNVEELIPLLENLPLSLQTGNDAEASATLSRFVRTAESLIRLVPLLKAAGVPVDSMLVDNKAFPSWIEELLGVLTELVEGYTNGDIILVGDLAEYEIAPRLAALAPALDALAPGRA